MAVLHFVQAAAMVYLAEAVDWSITITRLEFDTATQSLAPVAVPWMDVPLPYLVAAFLALSGIAHTWVAAVRYDRYVDYLERGMNPYRWYEYAVSASVMIVVIAMLSGIWDLGTLTALFGLVAVMNLCGLVMEIHNQTTDSTDWTSYWVGVVAGIIPWIVIGITLWSSISASAGEVPDFVLYIFVSIFVFFNLFAFVMVFQYRGTWRFQDYLFGEKTYIVLSLVAKSALAWQVFFGALNAPV